MLRIALSIALAVALGGCDKKDDNAQGKGDKPTVATTTPPATPASAPATTPASVPATAAKPAVTPQTPPAASGDLKTPAVSPEKTAAANENLPPLPAERASAANSVPEADLIPLPLELPIKLIVGTPTKAPLNTTVDTKTLGRRRGNFMVPQGLQLLSLKKPVKLSDAGPIMGDATMVTDGSKEGLEGNWVEMAPGTQWGQVDLGAPADIWAVALWHFHAEPRIYRDVIVQVSDDPAFAKGVTTLFNNDQDNSSGLGAGKDREYFESNEGKLIDGRATKARYVRCYSKGNTSDAQNHLLEIEVWGKMAK